MSFEYLSEEATADVAILAKGKNLDEAFEETAKAITNVMVDLSEISPVKEFKFKIKSEDLKSLLYDFIEELITIFEIKHLLFSEYNVKINKQEFSLICVAKGEKFNKKKHNPKSIVKAITYFGMEIIEKQKETLIKFTLDI